MLIHIYLTRTPPNKKTSYYHAFVNKIEITLHTNTHGIYVFEYFTNSHIDIS